MRPWTVWLAALVVFAAFTAAVGVSFALSVTAVTHSEHDWCQALSILTAKRYYPPADPAKAPAQEAVYRLYVSLVQLEHDYRC